MAQRHISARNAAFHLQGGRCFYCTFPMWNSSPDELTPWGLRARTVAPLRCTAEHLIAKQDGGKDMAGNIVAACSLCNQRRHKRKTPPSPEAYRAFVQKRLATGKWHCNVLHTCAWSRSGLALDQGA